MPGYFVAESVRLKFSDEVLAHQTVLPMAPFPGLGVGALTVLRVYMNQGGQNNRIEVEYERVSADTARILRKQGWS